MNLSRVCRVQRGVARCKGLLEHEGSLPENPVARFEEHRAQHEQREQRQRERLRASLRQQIEIDFRRACVDALGKQRRHARARFNMAFLFTRGHEEGGHVVHF